MRTSHAGQSGDRTVAEHEVMWIGRRPAAVEPAAPAAASESFAAAIADACAECGCDVDDYVAAAGVYGSWLVRFSRGGERQRLVWNGRESRLVLEQAANRADWNELASLPLSEPDETRFVDAVRRILGHVA